MLMYVTTQFVIKLQIIIPATTSKGAKGAIVPKGAIICNKLFDLPRNVMHFIVIYNTPAINCNKYLA